MCVNENTATSLAVHFLCKHKHIRNGQNEQISSDLTLPAPHNEEHTSPGEGEHGHSVFVTFMLLCMCAFS